MSHSAANNSPQWKLITLAQGARMLGYATTKGIQLLKRKGVLKYYYTPLSKKPKLREDDVVALISDTPPDEPVFEDYKRPKTA